MTYWETLNKHNVAPFDYELIPHGTLAKVKMKIKPGNYNDPAKGWTDGYATKSNSKDSIYLDAEFIILEGRYAKRKVWSKIGLHSINGPDWENIGMSFIKSMINSAHGLSSKDNSDAANLVRSINSFAAIDGIEFVARIDVIAEKNGEVTKYKNEIKVAVTPDHIGYAAIMSKAIAQSNVNLNINVNRPQYLA